MEQTIRPIHIDLKKLANKNGSLLPKEEMRVLLNVLGMCKKAEFWKEFCFEQYLKETTNSHRADELIIENFKARGWLKDPLDDGKYSVTDELMAFLEPFKF